MLATGFFLSRLISPRHQDHTIMMLPEEPAAPSLVYKFFSVLNMKEAMSLVMFVTVPPYQTSWRQ
jgi:hypothetical protein